MDIGLLCLMALMGCSCAEESRLPPVERPSLDSRQRRITALYDDAAAEAGGESVRPLADNADRVHLLVTCNRTSAVALSLAAPAAFGEDRLIETATVAAQSLGWDLDVRTLRSLGDETLVATVIDPQASRREGHLFRTEVDWPQCFAVLREAGIDRAEVRLRTKFGKALTVSECGLPWERGMLSHRPFLVAVTPTSAVVRSMEITFGFTQAAVRAVFAKLVLLFLVPFVLLACVRAWALARVGDDVAYHHYARLKRWLVFGVFIGWPLLSVRLGAHDLLLLPVAEASRAVRVVALLLAMFGIPLAIIAGLAAMSFRVEQQFREVEYSRGGYLLRSLTPIGLLVALILTTMVAMAVAPGPTTRLLFGIEGKGGLLGSPITFVLVFGGVMAVVGRMVVFRAMRPRHVEQGELTDRIRELCRQSGVEVGRVLIGHTEDQKVANAQVTGDGTILLTDYLVRRFTCEEVDAVVAHELAHLRLRHLGKRLLAHLVGLGAWLALVAWLKSVVSAGSWNQAVIFTFWIVPSLVHHHVSRRHELQADAEAVGLTGQPEVYVRMLKKLASVNRQPLRFERIDELMHTHPATARRIRYVATQYGLDDSTVQVLLAEAEASLEGAEEEPDRDEAYAVPEDEAKDQDLVFTPERRVRGGLTGGLLGVTPFFAGLGGAMLLMKAYAPDGEGWVAGGLVVGGFITGAAGSVLASRFTGLMSTRRLRPVLAEKVKRSHSTDLSRATFVGFSPGGEFRSYAGDTNWDIGFLSWEGGWLRYLGDHTAFELPLGLIVSTEVRTHKVAFVGSIPRLFVQWREGPEHQIQAFGIETVNARSVSGMHRATAALRERIEHERASATLVERGVDGLGPPPIDDGILSAAPPTPESMGCLPKLIAAPLALGAMAGTLFLVSRVGDKEQLDSTVMRYGSILAMLVLWNVLSGALQQWMERRKGVADGPHAADDEPA